MPMSKQQQKTRDELSKLLNSREINSNLWFILNDLSDPIINEVCTILGYVSTDFIERNKLEKTHRISFSLYLTISVDSYRCSEGVIHFKLHDDCGFSVECKYAFDDYTAMRWSEYRDYLNEDHLTQCAINLITFCKVMRRSYKDHIDRLVKGE